MNLIKELKNFNRSKLIKKFKTKEILVNKEWMPICEWKHKYTPKKIFIEKYKKRIITRNKTFWKETYKLKDSKNILFRGWNFSFLPNQFKIKNKFLFCKIPPEYFCLISMKKNNHFQNLILPKNIKLSSSDFVALGLLQGEMLNSTKGKSRHYFCFVNSEIELVKKVLELLKRFNINKDILSYQIIVNNKDKQKNDKKYINHWSKELNIPKKRFVKINYRKENFTKKEYGSISIKYYNTLFRLFIQYFLNENIKKKVENQENLAKFYLTGLFAAEGNVNLSSSLSLNYLCIGVSKKSDTDHYKRVLNCLNIKPGCIIKAVSNKDGIKRGWQRGNGGYMIIQSFENFKIFYNKHIIISPFKYLNFLIGLINYKKIKKDNIYNQISKDLKENIQRYKEIYNDIIKNKFKITKREKEVLKIIKDNTTTDKIAQKLNISNSSCSRILSSLHRKGFVKKEKISGLKLKYLITE